jgi:hypothetical protein
MPTIMELFKQKELTFPGSSTADGLVDSAAQENRGGFKQQVKNFAEQELSGVRVKSLVELNNPLIYGNEAVRIAKRSTPDKDTMLEALGAGDGKGLANVIGKARDAVNSTLGIPETLLPSRVVALDGKQKAIKDSDIKPINMPKHETNVAITKEGYGKNGTALGALLKASGGNPSTLGKQALGGAISAGKDALRGAIFGKRNDAPTRPIEPATYYGVDDSDKSGTRGEYVKTKEDELKARMGIEQNPVNPKEHKLSSKKPELATKTPAYFVSEEDSDVSKLQVPFWIESINKDTTYKFGKGNLSDNKMFFRTNITGLSETVTPTWSGNKFVGNPYNYYIYEGVERAVTFNLNIYCMDENELALNWQRIEFLTRQVYPAITKEQGEEGGLINAPFIKFQLGDMYVGRVGFIESLTYTIPDNSTWEIDVNGLKLPKFIDAAITIKLIETPGSEDKIYDYNSKPVTF